MLISYNWLNKYFANKLPSVKETADKLTMNFLEVDAIHSQGTDSILDVKVTPNLAHSALSHRGIARLVGALIKEKPAQSAKPFSIIPGVATKTKLTVEIEDEKLCRRYIGRVVENIKIGPSPEWLKTALESLGQRSISNIVDATNFVMFELGQPMHAFDADKMVKRGDEVKIEIKKAIAETSMTTLDGKHVDFDGNVLVISNEDRPLAVAGIKGGTEAEIDEKTTNIILESANFNSTLIRKTSQALKIQTDASKRYENDYTPEMAGEAMDYLTAIILEVAGTPETKIGEVVDNYPRRANPYKVGVSLNEINDKLGTQIKAEEVDDIFHRMGFDYQMVKPVDSALEKVKTLIGVPYRLGASVTYDAPKEFDCSSLMAYCYAQAGVAIPRVAIDQYVFSSRISESELQPGDLVFANTNEGMIRTETVEFVKGTKVPAGVDHVGMYIGDGKIIHATRHKNGVVEEKLAESEQFSNIVGYGRVSDNGDRWVVTAPVERLDLRITEDLIEDIAMVYGYSAIKDVELKPVAQLPVPDKSYYYACEIRKILSQIGFSEIYNYSFAPSGELEVANPINSELPFLRLDLSQGIKKALEFNSRYTDIIGVAQVKIFEFGDVFSKAGEKRNFVLAVKTPLGVKGLKKEKDVLTEAVSAIETGLNIKLEPINPEENILEVDFDSLVAKLPEPTVFNKDLAIAPHDTRFRRISQYPYMTRDVAVFVPEGVSENDLFVVIKTNAGELLFNSRLFDVFVKKFPEGPSKTSYAYRLIFQSYDRTLSGEEVDAIMAKINSAVAEKGWQVR